MACCPQNGAYILRNRFTETVLHARKGRAELTGNTQNANLFREQQIWWVERIPERSGELVSITNIAMDKAVELKDGLGENGVGVVIEPPHGRESQQWWIRGVQDDGSNGEYYTILNRAGRTVLELDWNNPCPGHGARGWKPLKDSFHNQWEFLVPVVAVPPGWIQIQSVTAGKSLRHNYLSSLVILSAPFTASSENRESWGSQWCFILPGKSNGGDYWLLKNRLTGGFLEGNAHANLTAPSTESMGEWSQQWRVEATIEGNWRLINRESGEELSHDVVGKGSDVAMLSWSGSRDFKTHWLIKEAGPGTMCQTLRLHELEGSDGRDRSGSVESNYKILSDSESVESIYEISSDDNCGW